MEYRVFTISAVDPVQGQDDLTRRCAERRVLAVDRQFAAAGFASFRAMCG